MEIKAMRWREFAKYPVEEQIQYLDDLRMIYRATRKNIIDMLGVETHKFERYCRHNEIRINWLYGKQRTRECALSPAWLEFIRTLAGEYGVMRPKEDCFAYEVRTGERTRAHCTALRRFYCIEGNCPFYRSKDEYAAEGMRLYGNPECIDHQYQKKIQDSYKYEVSHG